MKVLFILKRGETYGDYGYISTGLENSAKFVVGMLRERGIDAKLVEVIDNNSIDKEVHQFKPDVVVIEALWVTPEKFKVLINLHPKVKWIIRMHSDWPFLATEGVATEWLFNYLWHPKVYVAFNSLKIVRDFRYLVPRIHESKVLYLPNFYPTKFGAAKNPFWHKLRIGCFGAVRPLKNQLLQAIAAIKYADRTGKRLEFHINSTRCEQRGENVLKNLRGLFKNTHHSLIEHKWLNREHFLSILSRMDFLIAVSLSETFCIVAADAVSEGVPVICSNQIPWIIAGSIVPDPTDSESIVSQLKQWSFGKRWVSIFLNQYSLYKYSKRSRKLWLKELQRLSTHGK